MQSVAYSTPNKTHYAYTKFNIAMHVHTHMHTNTALWTLKPGREVECVTLCSTSVYNKLFGQSPWKRFLHSSSLPSPHSRESDKGVRGGGCWEGKGQVRFKLQKRRSREM